MKDEAYIKGGHGHLEFYHQTGLVKEQTCSSKLQCQREMENGLMMGPTTCTVLNATSHIYEVVYCNIVNGTIGFIGVM